MELYCNSEQQSNKLNNTMYVMYTKKQQQQTNEQKWKNRQIATKCPAQQEMYIQHSPTLMM